MFFIIHILKAIIYIKIFDLCIKLGGTISGEHEKLAILSTPDGRALKFGENEFISDDIQVVEIYNDLIVIRVNSEEEFEVYMNNKIKPREGN